MDTLHLYIDSHKHLLFVKLLTYFIDYLPNFTRTSSTFHRLHTCKKMRKKKIILENALALIE